MYKFILWYIYWISFICCSSNKIFYTLTISALMFVHIFTFYFHTMPISYRFWSINHYFPSRHVGPVYVGESVNGCKVMLYPLCHTRTLHGRWNELPNCSPVLHAISNSKDIHFTEIDFLKVFRYVLTLTRAFAFQWTCLPLIVSIFDWLCLFYLPIYILFAVSCLLVSFCRSRLSSRWRYVYTPVRSSTYLTRFEPYF